jgi:hypothetical protein
MADIKLIKAIVKGLSTFIPGVSYFLDKMKSNSKNSGTKAEFCYTLWLSILVLFKENGLHPNLAKISEIGSGGSLGVGLCALLSGSEKYYAMETDQEFNKCQNLKLLDEIVLLFKNKTRISEKYNQLNIKVNNLEYPEDIIKPAYLQENNIEEIRNDILNGFRNSKRIFIIPNWEKQATLKVDLIFSRAVMEHVLSPGNVYSKIASLLKKGSYMFHDIEFHSHGITEDVVGHYLIPDYLWKIIFGRREYFLNRWHAKDHFISILSNSFEIIKTQEKYMNMPKRDEDMLVGAIVLAKKINE